MWQKLAIISQTQTFILSLHDHPPFDSTFFKLSSNTFHFCACQLKTRGSFIVSINPFKTLRWSFFPFEIIQDLHFFPHSCSRFTMTKHTITAKVFECLFRTPCKILESSVKINIPNFYDSITPVQSASIARTK